MKSKLQAEQQIAASTNSESTIGVDLGDRWSRYCILDGYFVLVAECKTVSYKLDYSAAAKTQVRIVPRFSLLERNLVFRGSHSR